MSLYLLNKFSKQLLICFPLFLGSATIIAAEVNLAEINLEGLNGKQHAISDFIGKGKWTVLNVWGTDCPPCQEEIPDLVSFHDEHKDNDAIVVGIAIDFPSYGYAIKKDVSEFADNFMIDFPLLLSDGFVTRKLGLGRLEGLPSTYMFTPEGKLVGMQVGGITKNILEKFMTKHKKK